MCFCSFPGTQASLLSLLPNKAYDPREPGRARETTWSCSAGSRAVQRGPSSHYKLPQGPEIVHRTPSAGRTPCHLTNSPREHFALLGSAFRAEVGEDVPVSLGPCHSAEQAPAPTEQGGTVKAPMIITGWQEGFLKPFSHRHSPLNDSWHSGDRAFTWETRVQSRHPCSKPK